MTASSSGYETIERARVAYGAELPPAATTLITLAAGFLADRERALASGFLEGAEECARVANALGQGADAILLLNVGTRIAAALSADANPTDPKDCN